MNSDLTMGVVRGQSATRHPTLERPPHSAIQHELGPQGLVRSAIVGWLRSQACEILQD